MTVILLPHLYFVKSLLSGLKGAAVFDAGRPVPVSNSLVLENRVIDFLSH
jgi:hypothetical protein